MGLSQKNQLKKILAIKNFQLMMLVNMGETVNVLTVADQCDKHLEAVQTPDDGYCRLLGLSMYHQASF